LYVTAPDVDTSLTVWVMSGQLPSLGSSEPKSKHDEVIFQFPTMSPPHDEPALQAAAPPPELLLPQPALPTTNHAPKTATNILPIAPRLS